MEFPTGLETRPNGDLYSFCFRTFVFHCSRRRSTGKPTYPLSLHLLADSFCSNKGGDIHPPPGFPLPRVFPPAPRWLCGDPFPAPEKHGPHPKQHILFPLVIQRALVSPLWYTSVALNTAVVLCGSSGFVPDLRTPALRSSVRFQRNSKEDWQRKTSRQHENSCARRDCASKKAKCKIFQNYRFLPI
jgi:hypothetical protein